MSRPCGITGCSISTGICGRLTFGSGDLDPNGYWEFACRLCAADHAKEHKEYEEEVWPTEKDSITHDLKTWPQYYVAIEVGDKTFELRKMDRDYKQGDHLLLRMWNPDTKEYDGRRLKVVVSYLLAEATGLVSGYCIMGVKVTCDQ